MKTQQKQSLQTIQLPEIKEYKNKYRIASEDIYAALGVNNYSNVYNCMTRFRATITDKELVNIEAIKKLDLVKGVNWNGKELQIIIGGEVVKVVDEFKKYEEYLLTPKTDQGKDEIKVKLSMGRRFLNALVGIMTPSIGLLMASGIFAAIWALLTLPDASLLKIALPGPDGVLGTSDDIKIGMGNLNQFDVWASTFFVLKSVILNGIGVVFCYNAARYFKGNGFLAIGLGLMLMSRGFYPTGAGVPFADASFGDWTSSLGKSGFLLFKLGEYPIVVGGYEGAVVPYIVGGILISYIERWVKTWMPSAIDAIFRPTISIFVTIFSLWFLLAPFAGLFEYGLSQGMLYAGKVPYGFGTFVIALFYQPIVLTGAHSPISFAIVTDIANGNSSIIANPTSCSVIGQIAACGWVALFTKNMTLRRVAIGGVVPGIFGITEPAMYAVNVPKVRPFFIGCIAGAFGGMLSGILGVDRDINTGMGIFWVTGYLDELEIVWLLLTWALTIGVAFVLIMFFYKERKDEVSYFNKAIKKLAKIVYPSKDQKELKNSFKGNFSDSEEAIKSMKNDYKKMDKYYAEISKYESQLVSIENKESKHRAKMYKELMKLKSKINKTQKQELVIKFNELNEKYSTYNLDKEKVKAQEKLVQIRKDNESLMATLENWKATTYTNVKAQIDEYETNDNSNQILGIDNMIWNSLNAVEIGFGIEDAKPIKFKKDE